MHFVPVHLGLLQLTHFLSHIDARAKTGAVQNVNSSSAPQVRVIRPCNAIFKFLNETLLISDSLRLNHSTEAAAAVPTLEGRSRAVSSSAFGRYGIVPATSESSMSWNRLLLPLRRAAI